jgi:hypothetical protein
MNSYCFRCNNENNLTSHPDARFIPGLSLTITRSQGLKREVLRQSQRRNPGTSVALNLWLIMAFGICETGFVIFVDLAFAG